MQPLQQVKPGTWSRGMIFASHMVYDIMSSNACERSGVQIPECPFFSRLIFSFSGSFPPVFLFF